MTEDRVPTICAACGGTDEPVVNVPLHPRCAAQPAPPLDVPTPVEAWSHAWAHFVELVHDSAILSQHERDAILDAAHAAAEACNALGRASEQPAPTLDVRDALLEFGQWLANSPGRIYDLQDTIDSGDGDDFAAFVDMYLGGPR